MKSHLIIFITLMLFACAGTRTMRNGKSTIVQEKESPSEVSDSISNNAFPSKATKDEIVGELYKVVGIYAAVKLRTDVKVSEGTRLDIYDSEVLLDSNMPKVCTVEVIKVKDTVIAIKMVDNFSKSNIELKPRQLAFIPKKLDGTKNDLELARLKSLKEEYESNLLYVSGSVVNLRERYTTRSPVLKKLPRGAVVYVLQESNQEMPKWSRVKYREGDVWSHHRISEGDIDTEEKLNALYVDGWIHKSLLSTRKPPKIVNKEVSKPTKTQQAKLPATQPLGVLGRWLEVVPNLPEYNHIILIRKIGGGYVMETHHKDGSSGSSKLIEYFVAGERRFKEYGNTYDEYYVIDRSGGLRMYDREGYIKTALPVKH